MPRPPYYWKTRKGTSSNVWPSLLTSVLVAVISGFITWRAVGRQIENARDQALTQQQFTEKLERLKHDLANAQLSLRSEAEEKAARWDRRQKILDRKLELQLQLTEHLTRFAALYEEDLENFIYWNLAEMMLTGEPSASNYRNELQVEYKKSSAELEDLLAKTRATLHVADVLMGSDFKMQFQNFREEEARLSRIEWREDILEAVEPAMSFSEALEAVQPALRNRVKLLNLYERGKALILSIKRETSTEIRRLYSEDEAQSDALFYLRRR